jgi:hypothetical protein
MKEVATKVKCPTDGELKGCGSENVSDPDSEGFRDCFHCGLFYKDSSVTPDGKDRARMSNDKNCENCLKSAYELGSSLLLQKIVSYKMFGSKQYPKLARVVKIGNEFHFSISVNGYELEHCTAFTIRIRI